VPFTLAHPAAVLPFRRRLVLSALVVGSMAPDFEYFFRLKRSISHTMPGIVTFTFPLALAVLILFHTVVKWPSMWLLPRGLQARVIGSARRFRWLPLPRFLLILASLAIGIFTHVAVDSFTHPDGWVVVRWEALRQIVNVPLYHPMRMCMVLQLAGSAAGILLTAICFALWYRRAKPEAVAMRPQLSPAIKWAILIAMACTAAVLGYLNGPAWYGPLVGGSQRVRSVGGFAITTVTVGTLELFGFGVIWSMFRGAISHAVRANRNSS
jgi:hypothetical protein